MANIKSFFTAFALFIVFDFIWLGYVMKDYNMNQLAEIGRIENGVFSLHYPAAIATYFLMALAIPLFVLPKLTGNNSVSRSFFIGALMGLIIYGVFDLTNLAILKNYPLAFIAPDMAWGAFVYGLVTIITSKVAPLKQVSHT